MSTQFNKVLNQARTEALASDCWRSLFIAKVFLSVARPGFKCELFDISRLDTDTQETIFSILQLKGCEGWDSDCIHELACELERNWRHKLSPVNWHGSYARRATA